jgi:hypothetical protein
MKKDKITGHDSIATKIPLAEACWLFRSQVTDWQK